MSFPRRQFAWKNAVCMMSITTAPAWETLGAKRFCGRSGSDVGCRAGSRENVFQMRRAAGAPRRCISWAAQLNLPFGGKTVGNHKRGIHEEFKTCLWNYYGIMLPCKSWAPGPAFWVAAAGPLAMGVAQTL